MTDLNKLRSEFEATPEIKAILEVMTVKFVAGFYVSVGFGIEIYTPYNALLNFAWDLWQEKAKAQAVPEKKIYLTCEQLYAAANFGAPNKDPELLETELTIAWFDEAHSGSGYYVYISEYPEEGAMKLESESGAKG